jgi:HSP20 family protein
MTRFEPFKELARLQDEMSRMLNDQQHLYRSGESVGWTPACDIYEDEEGVTLRFDLAGVEAGDVDVRFENGVLTIRGERKLEHGDRRDRYHRIELDAEKIRAEAKNGVLVVALPKRSEAKPRSIQVKVN